VKHCKTSWRLAAILAALAAGAAAQAPYAVIAPAHRLSLAARHLSLVTCSLLLPLQVASGEWRVAKTLDTYTPPARDKVRVFAAIPPQAYLAERIAGPRADVAVLVGPGQSPHTFEPSPQQMARLAEARLFFAVGLPFEKRLLEKAAAVNPNLTVIDTRDGIALRRLAPAERDAHAAEHPAEAAQHAAGAAQHAAGAAERPGEAAEPDPHAWLSPRNARIMAATIARALSAADPAGAADYRANLGALQDDLDRLDAGLAETLAPLKGKSFFVYHPAFGYFADAYGLRQAPVEIEGKEPAARQLAALVRRAKAEGVRVIFVQPQFSARSARALADAVGAAVVPMDPLAKDYIANLAQMAEKIRAALGTEK